MKKRDSNFELLRILAIVLIICFHFFWNADYAWRSFPGAKRLAIDIFLQFGELGVNAFMLISGYFLAGSGKPFRLRKAVLLWLQVLFYSLIAGIVYGCLNPGAVDFMYVMRTVFPLTFKMWWYATAYILLYFCTPYLNLIIRNIDEKQYRRLLLFLLTVFSVWPTVMGIFLNSTESMWFFSRFLWMIVLYFLAGYIRLYDIRPSGWRPWLALHLGGWTVLVGLMAFWEKFGSGVPGVFHIDPYYFYTPNSVITVILSLSLFMIFKNISVKQCSLINHIGPAAFGIYLCHGGRSGKIWWNRIFHDPAYAGTWRMFAEVFAAAAVIMAAGLLLEIVRRQLERLLVIPLLDLISRKTGKLQ